MPLACRFRRWLALEDLRVIMDTVRLFDKLCSVFPGLGTVGAMTTVGEYRGRRD